MGVLDDLRSGKIRSSAETVSGSFGAGGVSSPATVSAGPSPAVALRRAPPLSRLQQLQRRLNSSTMPLSGAASTARVPTRTLASVQAASRGAAVQPASQGSPVGRDLIPMPVKLSAPPAMQGAGASQSDGVGSYNAGLARSGVSRDAYDSAVRSGRSGARTPGALSLPEPPGRFGEARRDTAAWKVKENEKKRNVADEYRRLMSLDVASAKAEADRLSSERDKVMSDFYDMLAEYDQGMVFRPGYGDQDASGAAADALGAYRKSMDERVGVLSAQLEVVQGDIAQAELLQKVSRYAVLMDEPDYKMLSAPKQSPTSDAKYNYINGLGVTPEEQAMFDAMPLGRTPDVKAQIGFGEYDLLSDDERGVYNYVYTKKGRGAAEEYLRSIREVLNYRIALQDYEGMDAFGKALFAPFAGFDSFAGGVAQLFSKGRFPSSPAAITSSMIRQEAWEKSKLLGLAYDLGVMAGGMAPSILLSSVTGGLLSGAGVAAGTASKVAGAAGLAANAMSNTGNIYAQKLSEGHSPERARSYAALTGIVSAGIQYALGGHRALGGLAADKLGVGISALDSAIWRATADIGVRAALQAVSSDLQVVVPHLFAAVMLDEDIDIRSEELWNAALMGALSVVVLEGPRIVSGERARVVAERAAIEAIRREYMGAHEVDYFEGLHDESFRGFDEASVKARFRELSMKLHPDYNKSGSADADMKALNREYAYLKGQFAASGAVSGAGQAAGTAGAADAPAGNAEAGGALTVDGGKGLALAASPGADTGAGAVGVPAGAAVDAAVLVGGGTKSSSGIISRLRDSIPSLSAIAPVTSLSGDEFSPGSLQLSEQVSSFFAGLGNKVFRRGLGNVIIDKRSVKDDIAHGIGRAKAVTFAAIPDVIEKGVQIGYDPDWKRRGRESYVFAAPVSIGLDVAYVGAVVLRGADNRFYLHEVVDGDGNLIYRNKNPQTPSRPGITELVGVTGAFKDTYTDNISLNSRGVNNRLSNTLGGAGYAGQVPEEFTAWGAGGLEAADAAGRSADDGRIDVSGGAGGGAGLDVLAGRGTAGGSPVASAPEYSGAAAGGNAGAAFERGAYGGRGYVPDGVGGRVYGAGPGEQAGVVERGAAGQRQASEQGRIARDRRTKAKVLRDEPLSARDLGIPRGTEVKLARFYPPAAWDDALRSVDAKVFDATGGHVTFVVGTIEVMGSDGEARVISAVYSGDGFIVRADHPVWSAERLADHELFHALSTLHPGTPGSPGLFETARAAVTSRFGEEEFGGVAKQYIQKLRGVIDVPADERDPAWKAAVDAIEEEVLADSFAGMNKFGFGADRFKDAARSAAGSFGGSPGRETATAVDRATGPPTGAVDVKFSVDDKVDEEYFAAIDSGDMVLAQQLVNDYAQARGYSAAKDYEGMHTAPRNDGFNVPIFDLAKIYPENVYSSNGVMYYGSGEYYDYEAMRVLLSVRDKPDKKIQIYRAVPKDVRETDIRNGDWVSVSKQYAIEHGKSNLKGYRILQRWVPAKHIYTNGDSLCEQGYDNGESMAYANTRNNAKSLSAVTYDLDGEIIPLSKRFDKRSVPARYSVDDELMGPDSLLHSMDVSGGAGYNALMERGDVAFGDSDETFTDGNVPIAFTYAVVPADALIVSNDEYGGSNPEYPAELQPRDRKRAFSQVQIQDMSRKLNPKLLADSPTAQNGAPVVRGDGAVIGGNARSQAILAAYESGRAGDYERFIRAEAQRFGVVPSEIPDRPVLVRVASNVDDWAALSRDLNAATAASYSATEQAMSDASKMGDILDFIVPNDEGDLNDSENRPFINAFVGRVVPAAERGGMLTSGGLLSRAGLERAKYAIFAFAYNDPDVLARLSESLDNDVKNVTNALLAAAPNAAAIRAGVEAGVLVDEGAVDVVLRAVRLFSDAKRGGDTVAELTAQLSLTDSYRPDEVWLAGEIERSKRSGKQIREIFNCVFAEALDSGDPRQASMFADAGAGRSLMERAADRFERETGRSIGRPDFGGYPFDGGVAGGGSEDAGERLHAPGGETIPQSAEGAVRGERGGAGPGASGGLEAAGGAGFAGEQVEGDSTGAINTPGAVSGAPGVFAAPFVRGPDWQVEGFGRDLPPVKRSFSEEVGRQLSGGRTASAAEGGASGAHRAGGVASADQMGGVSQEALRGFGADLRRGMAEREAAAASRRRSDPALSKEEFSGTLSVVGVGINIDGALGDYGFAPSLVENRNAAYQVRKAVKAAERRLRPSDDEKEFARGMAAGFNSLDDLPASMDPDKVSDLADYYVAEESFSDAPLRQIRKVINSALDEQMEELFRDAAAFKPVGALRQNFRTPERLMRSIFRDGNGNDERGEAINKAVFYRVDANEAERYRFKNKMVQKLKYHVDGKGRRRALSKFEDRVVKWVIEGEAASRIVAGMEMRESVINAAENIRKGADRLDAAREFSLQGDAVRLAELYARWLDTQDAANDGRVDSVIVKNAVKAYTAFYDEVHAEQNKFLVAHGFDTIGYIKGYAPHMQEQSAIDQWNGAIKSMLGLQDDAQSIPASIAGLTQDFKPYKRYNPYYEHRYGSEDDADMGIGSATDSYLDHMSDVVFHTDDIMRVRAASRYFRRTFAPAEIRENLSWAEGLRFVGTAEKLTFLRDRGAVAWGSELSDADVDAAMDRYVDKLYGDIKNSGKFSEFVKWLDNYANVVAGKQNWFDRSGEWLAGRKNLNVANKIHRVFQRAQVAGSLSSAVNQLSQVNLIVGENSVVHVTQALYDILSGKLRRGAFAEQSDYLTGKKGEDFIVTGIGQMLISAVFSPTRIVDGFTSTLAVRSRYLKEIAAGKSHAEAMKAADRYGRSVVGSRMKGSKPLAFESKAFFLKMVSMFQLEVANQWGHLTQDIPNDFKKMEREQGKSKAVWAYAAVIVKALLTAFILNRAMKETAGVEPVLFDVIGLTANFIASGEGLPTNDWLRVVIDNGWEKLAGERLFGTDELDPERGFDLGRALGDTGKRVMGDLPFARNAAGLFGLNNDRPALPNVVGRGVDVAKAFMERSEGEGDEGGGLVPEAVMQALIGFGAEVLPGGRQLKRSYEGVEALRRGGSYSGYGEDARLRYPVKDGFWDVVRGSVFGTRAMPETERFYASWAKALSKKQTAVFDSLVSGGADREELYNAFMEWRRIGNDKDAEPDSVERGRQQRDVIRGLSLSGRQKLELYRGLSGADSRSEKFKDLMRAGLSWDQVMDIYDEYAVLSARDDLKAAEKASAFAKWVDGRRLTAAQSAAVKDGLKFYSIVPAEATRYEKLTDAGLTAETAYTLTNDLAALEPLPGSSGVTDMQRYRVIDAERLSADEKVAAMGTIMGTDMLTESGNASQYAKMLDVLDSGASVREYLDLRESGGVDSYLKYVGAGISSQAALDMSLTMIDAKGEAGEDWRKSLLRWRAAVDAAGTQDDQLAALSVVMDEVSFRKASMAYDYGISPKQFVRFKELLQEADAAGNNNGSIDQKEAAAAIARLPGLSSTQKAVLYQLQSIGWKTNPYNDAVARKVRDAYQSAGAASVPRPLSLPSPSGGAVPLPGAAPRASGGLSLPAPPGRAG